MEPLAEEEMILHYYGESDRADDIERALEASPELRERYDELVRVLEAVEEPPLPEPSPFLAKRIWANIEGEAPRRRRSRWAAWLRPRREWALLATMLLVAAVSFVVGRQSSQPDPAQLASGGLDPRERILLVTVASHLERSEMLLLELANVEENGDHDISAERTLAADLKNDNRLYRLAAQNAGKSDVAALLGDLENILLELAHSPSEVPSSDMGNLRVRLEQQDLLFKVRVLGSKLLQESKTESPDNDLQRLVSTGTERDA